MENQELNIEDVMISDIDDMPTLESDKFDKLYDRFIGRLKYLSTNRKNLIRERNQIKKMQLREQNDIINQMSIDQYGHWSYRPNLSSTYGEIRLMVDVNNFSKDRSLKILRET